MKRPFVVMLFLMLMLLSACSGKPKADAELHGKVIQVYDRSFLLAVKETGELYSVSSALDTYDSDWNKGAELSAGQLVEIGFSGEVMDSYPYQLADPVYIRITGGEDDMVGFYLGVLDDLWREDTGLNTDIDILAFNMSGVENLSDGEKSAIAYVAGNQYGLAGILGSLAELQEQGYIDSENPVFENGLLFTVDVLKSTSDNLTFNASIWRSGTDAYYYNDCKAVKIDGSWRYSVGSKDS